MSWAFRTRRPRAWRIIAAVAVALLVTIFFKTVKAAWRGDADARIILSSRELSGREHVQNPAVQQYWRTLRDHLRDLAPQVDSIRLSAHASLEDQQVDLELFPKHPRLDLIKLEQGTLNALQQSHDSFLNVSRAMAPTLPYHRGTRGIVTTAGGKYFNIVVISLRMLRRTGSLLPVTVFLDTTDDYDPYVCEQLFRDLGAECVVMSELLNVAPPSMKPESCQYKILALLFSPFQEILFMDADAFPAHNPDVLFSAAPFTLTGLVTWPDFWTSTSSSSFYEITQITPVPSLADRRTSESGVMLYDKSRHGLDLLLALYYNFFGPSFYYPLLSQGAAGEGDKETFLHAALVAGAPFYDVKTPVRVIGRWLDSTWHTAGMKQADPREDWEVHQKIAAKSGNFQRLADQLRSKGLEERPSSQKASRGSEAPVPAFFIHHNIAKLDFEMLVKPDSPLHEKHSNGTSARLWGSRPAMIADFGYDVERVLWEEFTLAGCELMEDTNCRSLLALAETILGETVHSNQNSTIES